MAKLSFSRSLSRLAPYISYHHVLMTIVTISTIFLSFLVAGCTTPGLKNVYLLSLSYHPTPLSSPSPSQLSPILSSTFASLVENTTTLEVRTGYIGICISVVAGEWTCSTDADALARSLNGTQGISRPDPLNILWIAKTFRDTIVFDGFTSIAIMAIGFGLLMTFPGWHTTESDDGSEVDVKPFPSRAVSHIVLAAFAIAAVLALVSVLWQHVATATAASMGGSLAYGAVRGGVGPVAMVLGWGAVLLILVTMMGMLVMILAIRVLQDLGD